MGVRLCTAITSDDRYFYFLYHSITGAVHPRLYPDLEAASTAREMGSYREAVFFPERAADELVAEVYLDCQLIPGDDSPMLPSFTTRLSPQLMCLTGPLSLDAADNEEVEARARRRMRPVESCYNDTIVATPLPRRRRLKTRI